MKSPECHSENLLEVLGYHERIPDRSKEVIWDSLKDHLLTVGGSWKSGVLERDLMGVRDSLLKRFKKKCLAETGV